ncbi:MULTISPECIES: CHASE3 domain-containing protein [unclassified Leptolyngbya]|uniref:CHASE3 domain-containing protein n=1 Tax=unclassified Leptolyngbya TaxID=2650499 RepID=UPI001687C547|nr:MULTISPECIES: CHASE3 domain-containing protein [unclassified Leptolyngbya]MBD1911460.1 CHASE3 domain-containing protein [Leptolyngbya sp. FACHB-8]MBD2153472.1 CHASE3 domain-containing protein [Leptolyngbya sp. FACHB-16]
MKHQQMKLGRVVQAGFGSIFVIMLGIGVTSKFSLNRLVESNEWVSHTQTVEQNLEDITTLLLNAETGQRGYILTQQLDFLEPYNGAQENFEESFQELRDLIQDNPEQVRRLDAVYDHAQQKMEELANTIELTQSGKRDEALELIRAQTGKQLMDEIRAQVAEMKEVEEELLDQREATANQAAAFANAVSLGGTLIAIALGSGVLAFIARSVIRPINDVSNAIASSSNEIACTVEQQERTANQQSISVNETTSTMEELGASSQQSAQQAETAASSAQRVLGLTQEGNQAVERTLTTMAALTEKVGNVADQIVRLSEQTNQIGSISALVSDLANQTNMLALNAAVEAVRAGDQGKGFAVVAAEIRKLADQSRLSAEKINTLVADIQGAINSTVMVTDESTKTAQQGADVTQQTAAVFNNVTDSVSNIVMNVQQISLNARQQAAAVQQVLLAMSSLNVAARETASGITQTRTSTHQLNDAARQLQSVV